MKKDDIQAYLDAEKAKREQMSDRELLVRIDERMIHANLRADNHGDRIRVIERAIVAGLVGLVVAFKDNILSSIGAKGHP